MIDQLITSIPPLDQRAADAARARQQVLTKPTGSLGQLETLSVRIAGMTGNERPRLSEKVVLVMAADHGVAAAGVSAYPQEVTAQMVDNFLNGGAAINVLARVAGARLVIVDMGVASPLPTHLHLRSHRIGSGTRDLSQEPAMSRDEAMLALNTGAQVVLDELSKGLDLLALGDMGIGNTTPSSAIACAILGASPLTIVGQGTGVDDIGLIRKRNAVEQGLTRLGHATEAGVKWDGIKWDGVKWDGVELLAEVGGFEIAGLAGAMIAAAAQRVPVLLDGFITTAAAMAAVCIAPEVRNFLIASHRSEEAGHAAMLEWLDLKPLLDLGLRLGEGSGAALAMPILESAVRTLDEMSTFDGAGVSDKNA